MGSGFGDFAFFDGNDAVALANGGKPVRDYEYGAAFADGGHIFLDYAFGFIIKGGGRLDKKQNTRVVNQGSGNGNPLALPLRRGKLPVLQ